MVLLLRAGQAVPIEPAIFADLTLTGIWDQRPFLNLIQDHEFDVGLNLLNRVVIVSGEVTLIWALVSGPNSIPSKETISRHSRAPGSYVFFSICVGVVAPERPDMVTSFRELR